MAGAKIISLLDAEIRTSREAVTRDLEIAVAIIHRDINTLIQRVDQLRDDVDQLMQRP
jgi:uncharacterized protein HemX